MNNAIGRRGIADEELGSIDALLPSRTSDDRRRRIGRAKHCFQRRRWAKDLKGTGTVAVYDGTADHGARRSRIAHFEPVEKETGIKVVIVPRTDTGVRCAPASWRAPRATTSPSSRAARRRRTAREDMLLHRLQLLRDGRSRWVHPVKPGKFSVPHTSTRWSSPMTVRSLPPAVRRTGPSIWDVEEIPGPRSLPTRTCRAATARTFECCLDGRRRRAGNPYPLDWDRAFQEPRAGSSPTS